MSEITLEFWSAIVFTAIAYLILRIATRKGFFNSPPEAWKSTLTIVHVLTAFAIYFGVALFITPLIVTILKKTGLNPIGMATWVNLLMTSVIALFLIAFLKGAHLPIWRSSPQPHYSRDITIAAFAWIISFPLVLAASQFLDVLVYALFHVTILPDQVAVTFLKMTFAHPLYFLLAAISIVLLAPFIEELIFRGFLQTYARKFLSPKSAIVITSLCFSLFHFTPEQGLGNIPIIGSLFILSLFLGFVYERQQSLFCSISLHSLFNIISVINLYFLGGAPRGAL